MKVGPVVEVRSAAVKRTPSTVDPVLTEVVRHGLNATAEQMKVTLCRTAFSPVIYEMIDFAAGLYDTEYRMLAQARALPQFLGTLSFCLEAAVGRLGGLDRIHPGDVVWSTDGYDNGSHPQDAVVIVPAFDGERLVGFAVTKAHHLDIAAKDPYCTDTTDNFQEGVIFPAVKVYAGGELQRDMYRTILANSRAPKALEGDLNAQISAGAAGVAGLLRMMERHGSDPFWNAVEVMFNHGETATRRFLDSIPDGRYSADCQMDNNGITSELVKFSVTIEVSGSEAVVDFADCPPQQEGPINCPLATTVATARLGVMGLLGGLDLPNEGHFRPIAVRVAKRSMLCPEPPAPIFLYGWGPDQATEAMHRAMSPVLRSTVPAGSGGDLCGFILWGTDPDGKFWITGMDHPVGHGGSERGDAGGPLFIISCSGIRTTPTEVVESRNPLMVERYELAADTAGPGEHRGGCGVDIHYRVLEDAYITSVFERTLLPAWGLYGGHEGRANDIEVDFPDGTTEHYAKTTRTLLPAGSLLKVKTGGGGGYGPPEDRHPDAVRRDVEDGYITPRAAQQLYPQAFQTHPER
jgi:N-methylhydantoinase B